MSDDYLKTRIKKLSPLLINQLAAGEVVTRPAAVVKELLENAIDAGATCVEVRITQGGMGMIEVTDNGSGIHPDDMVMAITRHATSKVADVANLHGIETLGFRGEALAATAAVSRLTLTSSHDDSGIGRQLQVAGILAQTPTLVPVVHKRGTTVTVKDLYFNVPARRGNLKSIATEFGHIETIVCEVALARADVALSLYHDNKKRLSLSGTLTHATNNLNTVSSLDGSDSHLPLLPLARLEQALGVVLNDRAIAVTVDLSSLLQHSTKAATEQSLGNKASISGWLWPINDQQDALPKLLYINGRLIKEPIVSNQLRQLAQSANFKGLGYALYFNLPSHWLNINVHPTKQRIKISPLNNIIAHLSHSIRLKLKALDKPDSSNKEVFVPRKLNHNIKVDASNSFLKTSSLLPQVQAPKHDYQYSKTITREDLEQSLQADLNFSDKQVATNKGSTNRTGLTNTIEASETDDLLALPYCLDVISQLPVRSLPEHSHSEHTSFKNNLASNQSSNSHELGVRPESETDSLPWLLLYYGNKLLLVSAKAWQLNLDSLFESNTFNNEIPADARQFNEQLSRYAAQMSTQDLLAFTTDIGALVTKQAIGTVDTPALVVSILSSQTS